MFNIEFPNATIQKIAVKLTKGAEKRLLSSPHPWLFSDSIQKINKKGNPGDLCVLFRQKSNQVFGVGLYDPHSPILIKMIHYYESIFIDEHFFRERIQKAASIRVPLLQTDTNSYRLIFGENDGLPGCIVDVYDSVCVVKLYSAIWFPYMKWLCTALVEHTNCSALVLRLSRRLQALQNPTFKEGSVVYGKLLKNDVLFREHGVQFFANVIEGHKTGFFLDHRENRRKVGDLAHQKSVLDVFSYAGGFSTHALKGGAKSVTSLDISKHALALAQKNVSLNSLHASHQVIIGDAFQQLQKFSDSNQYYDMVIIDPPSFAKKESEVKLALKKYKELANLAAPLVKESGVLVLASCSSRVTSSDFFELVHEVCTEKGFFLIERTEHDIDHPVQFKEGAYLKCAYYQKKDSASK